MPSLPLSHAQSVPEIRFASPVQVIGKILLVFPLCDLHVHVPSDVRDNLALLLLIRTTFIDRIAKEIFRLERCNVTTQWHPVSSTSECTSPQNCWLSYRAAGTLTPSWPITRQCRKNVAIHSCEEPPSTAKYSTVCISHKKQPLADLRGAIS